MNVEGVVRLAHSVGAKVRDGAFGRCLVFLGGALSPIVSGELRPIRAHHRYDVMSCAIKKRDAVRIIAEHRQLAAIGAYRVEGDQLPGSEQLLLQGDLLTERIILCGDYPKNGEHSRHNDKRPA